MAQTCGLDIVRIIRLHEIAAWKANEIHRQPPRTIYTNNESFKVRRVKPKMLISGEVLGGVSVE